MIKMKKYLALLLAVLMIAAFAAGCAGDKAATPSAAPSAAPSGGAPAGPEASSDEYGSYTPLSDGVKKVTIVYGDDNREGSVVADGIIFLQKLLNERSDGKIDLQTHFNLTLGTSNGDIFHSVCAGDVDMCTGTPGSPLFGNDTAIMDVPALFADWDLLWECLQDSEFHDAMCDLSLELGATSLYYAPKSYRVMTSNKPVSTTADLKGIDMRLPGNPVWLQIWSSMGVNANSIPMNEVYLSLQQGVVGAQENSWEQIVNNNLLEVQKYLIFTNHVHDAFGMFINTDFYEGLDPEVRTLLDECFAVTYDWYNTNINTYLEDIQSAAKAQADKFGSTFMDPDPSFMVDMANATEDVVRDVRAFSATADNLTTLALKAMGHDPDFGK